MLDDVDNKAVQLLIQDGRATWADLAQALELSPPAAADRVRRLEERGVILGYSAVTSAAALGLPMTAFVAVTLGSLNGNFKAREEFLEFIRRMEEVQECHHLAGSDDFLLKVRCSGTEDLERILIERLRSLPIVTHTRTMVVLGTVKEAPGMSSVKPAPARNPAKR